MYVSSQAIDFFEFVLIGMLISFIFDFFRSYRKIKKVNTVVVIIQDIIYFIIVTLIIIFSIVKVLDSQIRLYIFMGIILGSSVYFSTISKYIIKLYIYTFNISSKVISDFLLPLKLNIQFLHKSLKKMQKIWKKCCKLFFYMLFYIYKFFKMVGIKITLIFKFKNKRGTKVMRKKVESSKSNKSKNKKIGIVHILSIGFSVYFLYTLVQQQIQINKYDSQIKMYTADIQNKSSLASYYSNQKGSTKTDEYIENVARESLGYVKPYEKIFVDANK